MRDKTTSVSRESGIQADRHWKEVMDLARQYGFIAQAYGGTALLITHRVQLEEYGERGYLRIQKMNGHCARDLGYPGCLTDNGQIQDCRNCGLARYTAGQAGGSLAETM